MVCSLTFFKKEEQGRSSVYYCHAEEFPKYLPKSFSKVDRYYYEVKL